MLQARRNSAQEGVFPPVMRAKAWIALLGLALALALAAGATAIATAGTAAAPRSVVLGKTANYPTSGCPATQGCEVVARVTGIQMEADTVVHPFRAPSTGQL